MNGDPQHEQVPPAAGPSQRWKQLSAASVGLEMAIAICLGLGAGYWCQRRWHLGQWVTLFGLGLGIVAAFNSLYQHSRRYQRELNLESKRLRNAMPPVPKDSESDEGPAS